MEPKEMGKWEALAVKVLSLILITEVFVPVRESSWQEFALFMIATAVLSYLVIWFWDMGKALMLVWKKNIEA